MIILDRLKKILLHKENDAHEFEPLLTEIEQSPANPLGHTIFWLVIFFILFASLWMYFGKVDVVVTTRGIVIPDGEEKVVQSLEKGVVSNIFVKEGDYVEAGQVLTVISPAEHEPGLELAQLKEEELKLKEQLSNIKSRYQIASERLNRLESVRDIITQARYEEALNEETALRHEKNSVQASLTQNLTKREQLEKQIQTIKSPIDGYINKLEIHTLGGVVTPAQELMTVVPKDAKLKIKAKVMNQDIGFVEEGMDVSIKVDTFNFQKYGILKGKVLVVGANSILDEQMGQIYEIFIKPENLTLMVEGKEQSIKSGMSTTCEVNIGKRRIIEFFIYPLIKYLDESIKVR
ncbi:HlyD family efflux transporter periplasmic adaptor subunit [bacterium]|nr:HlyD family efflux transporter periplasmic adaptor subunit [bacterium]